MTRCGYVAILGIPNAGKSTLVNALVGGKVSIVSHKVQTTRRRVLGIFQQDQTQVILMDTPGIFTPKKRLDRAMVGAAYSTVKDADLVCIVVDVTRKNFRQEDQMITAVQDSGAAMVLILNKIDAMPRAGLLEIVTHFSKNAPFQKVFMVSAKTGDGLKDLATYMADQLPAGPFLFDGDQMTDLALREWAAEITREEVFKQLHAELPYETMVETETWEEFKNGSVKITQQICIMRDSQKKIVIGNKGSRIQAINKAARAQMEAFMDRPVHLFLHVKVVHNWPDRHETYRTMGLDYHSKDPTSKG